MLAGCGEGEKSPAKPPATVLVERVIDGDTVVATHYGKTRLIGVDAPEEGRCGGYAATDFTRRRLDDRRVKYELGVQPKDRDERTLAYLTTGDTMHNLALVEEGYAAVLTVAPNDKYADRFEAAQDEANQRKAGPQEKCARQRRRTLAEKRARARERARARRRAARLPRRVRAAERRARAAIRRTERFRRGGSGGGIPKSCKGVNGPIPTPPGDPTNLDRDNNGKACE